MKKSIILFSTEETAKMLGITRQGLAYRIKKGKIKPVNFIKSKYKFFEKKEIEQIENK